MKAAKPLLGSRGHDVREAAEGGKGSGQSPLLPLRCVPEASPKDTEPLPGGFKRGDLVQSLITRERQGLRVLEVGNDGMVVGAVPPAPSGYFSSGASAGSSGGGGGAGDGGPARLLVQFKLGFDWLLAPQQVCLPTAYATTTAAKLPGGYSWGDRVRSLLDHLILQHDARGVCLGDAGTIIGPGDVGGKVAVRFDDNRGEWSIWPNALCLSEAYAVVEAATLPAGYRRGDSVRTKSCLKAANPNCPLALEEGERGVVIGPGHVDGRLLVFFASSGRRWSMQPTQLTLRVVAGPTAA